MPCRKCKNNIKTQIMQLGGVGYFDVNKAIKILQNRPRASRKLTKKEFDNGIRSSKIDKKDEHLKHVNISVPGILGQTDEALFMLDGNHRMNRARILKKDFHVFPLTEFETGQVFRKDLPKGKKYV